METSTSTPVRTRTDFDREVEERLETTSGDTDWAGWWCVATDPFPCPATNCDFVAEFMTCAHLILVWPEKDDRDLLHHAALAKRVGRNPRVVEYEPSMGPCISYDLHREIGRPVHGMMARPEGWPE